MAKPKHIPDTWDQHAIKAELHRQGMTVTKLAELAGMSVQSFSHVWKRSVTRAEKAIAGFLNLPAKDIWPDRYPKRTARILSSKNACLTASQKDDACPDKEAA